MMTTATHRLRPLFTLAAGYGYHTKPERGNDSRSPAVTGVNKGGDRFYSTASLGAKLRF